MDVLMKATGGFWIYDLYHDTALSTLKIKVN